MYSVKFTLTKTLFSAESSCARIKRSIKLVLLTHVKISIILSKIILLDLKDSNIKKSIKLIVDYTVINFT